MCSICGGHYPLSQIQQASQRMRHRGPDSQGSFSDDFISLAHNRLSIIDLNPSANQPFCSPYCPDLVLVFNGEIYNYSAIKQRLQQQGVPFNTHSDTEVLLHAFAFEGEACLQDFNGDFAFAIYNKRTQALFLARDRLGNKPLFYHLQAGKLFFASELKAFNLKEHGYDEQEVATWLLFGSGHTHQTIYNNIFAFPPGHFAYFKKGQTHLQPLCYWDFKPQEPCYHTLESALEELDFLLQDSVRIRLNADVPVALSVSGGIDSSLIAHYIKKTQIPCHYFGVSFKDFKQSDESVHIAQLAKDLEIDITLISPELCRIKEHFNALVSSQDEIFRSLSVYAQFLLFQNIAPYCKVALGGQGADELFGGYYHHVSRYIFNNPDAFKERIRLYGNEALREYQFGLKCSLPPSLKRLLFAEDNQTHIHKLQALNLPIPSLDYLMERFLLDFTQSLWLDTLYYSLPHLLRYEDRNAMSFGVENRTPFTDYRIVEFAFKLDPSLKCAKGYSKYILRALLDKLGSHALAWRVDKMGFVAPEGALMQTLGYSYESLFDVRLAVFDKLKELQ